MTKFKVGDKFLYKKHVWTVDRIDFYCNDYHFIAFYWDGPILHTGCFFEKEMKPIGNFYEQLKLF